MDTAFQERKAAVESSLSVRDCTIQKYFKLAYDDLEIIEITETNCEVKGKESRVKGTYSVMATSAGNSLPLSGNWKVDFELDEKFGYWYIHEVIIEGIVF